VTVYWRAVGSMAASGGRADLRVKKFSERH
jgi:hypothetical protein